MGASCGMFINKEKIKKIKMFKYWYKVNEQYVDCCKELSKKNSSEGQASSGQFVIWQ